MPQGERVDAGSGQAVVIGVDTGGTFTDVFASSGAVRKVPSTPDNPARAILLGLREVGLAPGDAIGHGTTVATNAILERKGARTALLTTAGFEDVLEIRRQNRPSLYDLNARWPAPLVARELRLGVTERLDFEGNVLTPLDGDQVVELARRIGEMEVESVAICLLFAYVSATHEKTVVSILRELLGPNVPITASHEIAPQLGEFERTSTTCVNAYVVPVMRRYLRALKSELEATGAQRVHVMQSNGGLVDSDAAAERPVHTVLSGPAAGVVGAHALARRAGCEEIITFDMGGTSTDVAVAPGEVLESGEGEIASFPLFIPMLTIETVGAGGGSIARVDAGGGLHVGPDSAGADPGPAAYGRGEAPTVTDANLVLGRLSAHGLLGGAMPLDVDRARVAIGVLGRQLQLRVEQAAWAVIRLANSNMERAVRTVSLQRGYDPRRFTLFPFGGAGPLHGVELAADLGITRVLVPPHPGVMAALGLTIPDLQRDFSQTVLVELQEDVGGRLDSVLDELEMRARLSLGQEALFGAPVFARSIDARYAGQSFELRIPYTSGSTSDNTSNIADLRERFTMAYRDRYGYDTPAATIEIVNVRLRATMPRLNQPNLIPDWPEPGPAPSHRDVWFGSSIGVQELHPIRSAVLWRPSQERGTHITGPAVIEQYDSATVVPPGWDAIVDERFNLVVSRT